nr:hypothetical protein [Tanacetum cinerariifolium]
MHKAFPLPGESFHWQYKFPLPVEGVPTARRMEIPLPGVCTAMMKKLPAGTSNWQNQMPSRRQDAGILDPNLCDRARREPQPSVYMLSPYTNFPPTTVLTKKKVDKTKKKGKTTKLSPLNLGNNFAAENVSVDDVTITGVHQTDNYFNYEIVDPDKVTRDGYVLGIKCTRHSHCQERVPTGSISSHCQWRVFPLPEEWRSHCQEFALL